MTMSLKHLKTSAVSLQTMASVGMIWSMLSPFKAQPEEIPNGLGHQLEIMRNSYFNSVEIMEQFAWKCHYSTNFEHF